MELFTELFLKFGGETISVAVIVIALVAALKQWLGTKGWINTLLAILSGTGIGAGVYLISLLGYDLVSPMPGIWVLLIKGAFSGIIAAGGFKAIKGFAKAAQEEKKKKK